MTTRATTTSGSMTLCGLPRNAVEVAALELATCDKCHSVARSLERQPGSYRLRADVTNRAPDRRTKHDWRLAPVFKAGDVFVVDAERNGLVPCIRKLNGYRSISKGEPSYAALLEQLEPIVETATIMLGRLGWSNLSGDILNRLVAEGTITLEQVKTALDAELAEEE